MDLWFRGWGWSSKQSWRCIQRQRVERPVKHDCEYPSGNGGIFSWVEPWTGARLVQNHGSSYCHSLALHIGLHPNTNCRYWKNWRWSCAQMRGGERPFHWTHNHYCFCAGFPYHFGNCHHHFHNHGYRTPFRCHSPLCPDVSVPWCALARVDAQDGLWPTWSPWGRPLMEKDILYCYRYDGYDDKDYDWLMWMTLWMQIGQAEWSLTNRTLAGTYLLQGAVGYSVLVNH